MAKINWSSISGEKKDKTPKDTSNIFKLTKDEHLLRIIPFPLKSKHFDAKYFNEDNNVFVPLFVHKSGKDDIVPYRDEKATLSLRSFDKEDPIEKFSKQLYYDNSKGSSKQNINAIEIAKQLMPERPTYCCVIDREETNPVPKLWKISKFNTASQLFMKAEMKLKKKLKMDEDDELDWTDVNEGYDITVSSIKSSYNNFPFYDISSVIIEPEQVPVCDSKAELNELYASMSSPFDLYHIVSYTDLEELLDKSMRGDDEDEDDNIKAKPKTVAKPTKKVLIEDEDDEDDEEEEAPVLTKSKQKAKPTLTDDDDDDDEDEPEVKPKAKTKVKAKIADDDDDDETPAPKAKTKANEKDFGAMFKGGKQSLPQDDDNLVPF